MNDSERLELEEAVPSAQMAEQDLKRQYQEYRAYAEQRVYYAYGSLVDRIAEVLTQHDPLSLVPHPGDPEHTRRRDGALQEVPKEYNDMALWIALRLPEASTTKDTERHIHEMFGKRLRLVGRRNRARRMAIASRVWEVWQSMRDRAL